MSCSENYNPNNKTSEDTALKGDSSMDSIHAWLNKEVKTAHGGAAQEPTVSANQFEGTLVLYKPLEIAA